MMGLVRLQGTVQVSHQVEQINHCFSGCFQLVKVNLRHLKSRKLSKEYIQIVCPGTSCSDSLHNILFFIYIHIIFIPIFEIHITIMLLSSSSKHPLASCLGIDLQNRNLQLPAA